MSNHGNYHGQTLSLCTIDRVPSNCSNGDIQLSQGSQGIIEICIDGYWGTICDNQWDNIDASVVCQQLGHSYHGMSHNNVYNQHETPYRDLTYIQMQLLSIY